MNNNFGMQPGMQPGNFGGGFNTIPPKPNGKALAGLILGIVALILCWSGPIGAIIALIGLIISILGLRAAAQYTPDTARRGMAIAGIILSVLGLIAGLVFTVGYYIAFTVVKDANDSCSEFEMGSEAYLQCIEEHFGGPASNVPGIAELTSSISSQVESAISSASSSVSGAVESAVESATETAEPSSEAATTESSSETPAQ
ncbi:MAG: hypothetical protein Q3972_07160 [Corynebacterium sp.]|nr:hypothetical protein [Corynebacterium sp.]